MLGNASNFPRSLKDSTTGKGLHCIKSPFPGSRRGCHCPNSFWPGICFLYKAWSFPENSLPQHEFSQNSFESVSVRVHRQKFFWIFLFSSQELYQNLWYPVYVPVPSLEFSWIHCKTHLLLYPEIYTVNPHRCPVNPQFLLKAAQWTHTSRNTHNLHWTAISLSIPSEMHFKALVCIVNQAPPCTVNPRLQVFI